MGYSWVYKNIIRNI